MASKKFIISDGKKKFNIAKSSKFKIEDNKFVVQSVRNNVDRTNINNVIQKVHSSDYSKINSAYASKVVAINIHSGNIHYEQQAMMRRLFRFNNPELVYYNISTKNIQDCETNCTIKDFYDDRLINLNIKYEVRCIEGNEENVALFFYNFDDPGEALAQFIVSLVNDFAHDLSLRRTDFILNYFDLHDELKDYIISRVKQKSGLNLRVNILLENENKLYSYPIRSDFFSVRAKDCLEETCIKYYTELNVDENNKINAILYYDKLTELQNVFEEKIKSTILNYISFNELCFELNGRVQNVIKEVLNSYLSSIGRKIFFIALESSANLLIPDNSKRIEHIVDCKISESFKTVKVEHVLLLSLEDVGKYRTAKIENLDEWIKNKLDVITQTALFEKTYEYILLDFNPNQIKREMEVAVNLIGYKVKHLASVPDLDPLKLKDGFKIEDDGIYVTRDSRIKVKLKIIVRGAIKNLRDERIKKYLNPQIDIIEEIRTVICEEIEKYISNINPERFYTCFYHDNDNEKSVEQELKSLIEKILEDKFCASEINVIPKQLETKIANRFQELQRGFNSFEFEVFPAYNEGDGEPVKFLVDFKIVAVDSNGWSAFQSNNYDSREMEINDIVSILKGDIKSKLETIPFEKNKYKEYKVLKEIEDVVNKFSIPKIVDVFGLVIKIINLRRLPTSSEVGYMDDIQAKRSIAIDQREVEIEMAKIINRSYLNQLSLLLNKRNELILNVDDEDEELKSINQHIKEIIQKNPMFSIKGDKDKLRNLISKIDSNQNVNVETYLDDNNKQIIE